MAFGPVPRALLTSALLILCFPRPDQGYLALLALVPLLSACRAATARRAFVLGWAAATVWFFVSLSWLTVTMTRYGGIPVAVSHLLILALAAFHGTMVGAFAACVPSTERFGRWAQAAVLASVWVACEFARSWIPAPFPWLLLGSAFWKCQAAAPVYSAAGVYGLSWAAAAVNALLLRCLTDLASRRWRAAAPSLALMAVAAAAVAAGWTAAHSSASGPTIRVAVVQGSFGQEEKWDEAIQEQTLDVYLELSRKAADDGASLILWPETSVPFFFQSEGRLAERIAGFVSESGAHLVFGSPAYDIVQNRVVLFNSAYHLAPGAEAERYDKVRLVPFGEYVPFKWALPFVEKMVPSIGEFRRGRWVRPFQTPVPSGPLICYEAAMPGLARREVRDGSRILVNMTNDAWFGESWGPYQHLALASIRAAENGVPLARAANTGISALVDRRGRVVDSIGLFRRGVIVADLEAGARPTVYGRTGDLIVYFSAVVVVFYIWNGWRRRRAKQG